MPMEDDIQQLTTSVWDAILHLPIETEQSPLPVGRQTMSASIYITGDWRGAVSLICDAGMAADAATVMFGLAGAEPSKFDMQDALGELVNMIGGNVKALLPGACQLSLPSVVEGADYSVRIPGSRMVTRVPLRCGVHPISVTLLQSEDKAA